jgi:glycosyltransferase involved in cell wall biosynthesis
LKILLINHFPLEGSGSGVYTKTLAIKLVSYGHDVKIIFPEHKRSLYEKEKFKSRVIKFASAEDQEDLDVNFNFPCFTSHPRSSKTFYDLSESNIKEYMDVFQKIIDEEVASFKPDIIHAQHLWIVPYLLLKTEVPYVVTAHGTDIKGFIKDQRYEKYALEGARGTKKIITISKQVDADVEEFYGISQDKRELILNGYDKNVFNVMDIDKREFLRDLKVDDKYTKIVSFAGKFAHFKGIDTLLDAALIYEKKFEDVVTLIAGDGELRMVIEEHIKRIGLKNVVLLGHVDHDKLAKLYNVADVSVVPSRNEPFGLVAIEALACGTPVVASNQGGLKEIINEKTGKLFKVDDHEELAEAIISELENPEKEAKRIMCSNYAIKNFEADYSCRKVEALYKKAIEK